MTKRVYRNTKTLFPDKRIDLSTCTLVRLLFVIRSSLKIMLNKPIPKKKKNNWRIRILIAVPRACEGGALPLELTTPTIENGRFYTEDALSVWMKLDKHSLFVWVFVCSIETGTRRIIRLDEQSCIARLERRTTEDSPSRRIMCLVTVFILATDNQRNNECLPKFVHTDNASSSIKTTKATFL